MPARQALWKNLMIWAFRRFFFPRNQFSACSFPFTEHLQFPATVRAVIVFCRQHRHSHSLLPRNRRYVQLLRGAHVWGAGLYLAAPLPSPQGCARVHLPYRHPRGHGPSLTSHSQRHGTHSWMGSGTPPAQLDEEPCGSHQLQEPGASFSGCRAKNVLCQGAWRPRGAAFPNLSHVPG